MIRTASLSAIIALLLAACSGASAPPADEPSIANHDAPDDAPVRPAEACDTSADVLAEAWATIRGAEQRGGGGYLISVRDGGAYSVRGTDGTHTGCLDEAQRGELAELVAQANATPSLPSSPSPEETMCKAYDKYYSGVSIAGGASAEWAICESSAPGAELMAVYNWLVTFRGALPPL